MQKMSRSKRGWIFYSAASLCFVTNLLWLELRLKERKI